MDYCDTPEHELEVTGQQLDGNVFDEPQEVEFIITIIINVLYCKICIVSKIKICVYTLDAMHISS